MSVLVRLASLEGAVGAGLISAGVFLILGWGAALIALGVFMLADTWLRGSR